MSKPKVLMTASTFPRYEGDTEPRFVLDLAKSLSDYFDITVLAPMDPSAKENEKIEGIQVKRYHYFPIHKWETLCYPGAIVPRIKEKKIRFLLVPFLLISLWAYLLRHHKEYDLVHAHWLIPQGIVQSFFPTRYIVTGHGGDVTSLNAGIIKYLKKRCLSKASEVSVVSEKLKKDVLQICELNNVNVIPMGCDTSMFSPKYREENYFGQNGKKVVLFVGRLAEKKGVTYLLEAMKNVNALLVIAGSGPCEMELKKQAADANMEVLFLGPKTHEELREIYASADIFVMPSVTAKDGDQEGFGLVMLEAMASGLPVVAFDSGGISQLINDGENGLLCEERDIEALRKNIKRVLNEPAIYQTLVKGGKKSSEEYSYINISKKYMELYKECINEEPSDKK